MITILFHVTVKVGREEECNRLVNEAMASTRAEDRGCVNYAFYRRSDDPRELVLFEQWTDTDALAAHIVRLQRVYGPPDDNEPYPATHHRRRLPKSFLGVFERTEAVRYDTVE
jgi:quinol monooxygenase YgiN